MSTKTMELANCMICLVSSNSNMLVQYGYTEPFIEVPNQPSGNMPIDVIIYNDSNKNVLAVECKSGSTLCPRQHARYISLDSSNISQVIDKFVSDVDACYFVFEENSNFILNEISRVSSGQTLPLLSKNSTRIYLNVNQNFSKNCLNVVFRSMIPVPVNIPNYIDLVPDAEQSLLIKFVLSKIGKILFDADNKSFKSIDIVNCARISPLFVQETKEFIAHRINDVIKDLNLNEFKGIIFKSRSEVGVWNVRNFSRSEKNMLKLQEKLSLAQERIFSIS